MSGANLFNLARRFCHERVGPASAADAPWEAQAQAIFYASLLYEVEQFVAEDLATPDEARALLGLAADATRAQARRDVAHYGRHLLRRHRLAPADLEGAIDAAHQAFQAALAAKPRRPPAPLPYRRALPAHEASALWARLDAARAELHRATYWDIDAARIARIVAFLEGQRPARLYQLAASAAMGYELDPAWANEMFNFDGSHWFTAELSWYLYAEGSGYPVVAGDLAAHLGV